MIHNLKCRVMLVSSVGFVLLVVKPSPKGPSFTTGAGLTSRVRLIGKTRLALAHGGARDGRDDVFLEEQIKDENRRAGKDRLRHQET